MLLKDAADFLAHIFFCFFFYKIIYDFFYDSLNSETNEPDLFWNVADLSPN